MSKDWNRHKAEIETLYITKRKTLSEVRRLLKGKHGFVASTRAYRMRLEIWGFKKNRTDKENEDIASTPPRTEAIIQGDPPAHVNSSNHLQILPEQGNFSSAPSSSFNMNLQVDEQPTWVQPPLFLPANEAHNLNNHSFTPSLTAHNPRPAQYGHGQESIRPQYASDDENLNAAIRNRNEQSVSDLLSAGVSVNVRNQFENQPLHEAILTGYVPTIKLLLRYGAKIDSAGSYGRTPLHLATSSPEIMQLLLKSRPALSHQDQDGNTALHFLLMSEELGENWEPRSSIQTLLSLGAEIDVLNAARESPFHILISRITCNNGSVPLISLLLNFLDQNPNIHQQMPNGTSPFAATLAKLQPVLKTNWESSYVRGRFVDRQSSERKCLKKFLTLGANPNTIVNSGRPLLNYCLEEGIFQQGFDSDELLMLIFKLADVNLAGPGRNCPLHLLLGCRYVSWHRSYHTKLDYLNVLIDRGVDVNRENSIGACPLELLLCENQPGELRLPYARSILREKAVTMRLASNGKSLFEFIEKFAPESERFDLIKAFLEADMDLQPALEALKRYPPWAPRWRKACQERIWVAAKRLIDFEDSDVRPQSKLLLECLFTVITEQLLRIHKTNLVEWQAGRLEKHVVRFDRQEYIAILKDCNERRTKIDPSWYTYLLQLMDFE